MITTTELPPVPTSPPERTLSVAELPPWLQSALAALDKRVEAGSLSVPLLPEAATTLLLMTEDEDADLDRLTDVVRSDPTMAAQLLRIANSPLFVSRYPIASLRTALSRLGMFQVRQIALLIVCDTKVFRVRGWEQAMRSLFAHSVLVALFSDGRNALVLHLANQLARYGAASPHGVEPEAPSGTFQVAREVSGELEVPAEAAALGLSHADVAELVAMRQALTTKAKTIS